MLRSHGLDAESPRRVLAALDRLEQILVRVVGVLARELDTLLLGEEARALVRDVVELGVDERAVLLDELVSVAGVAVHLAVTVRDTAVAKQDHDLSRSKHNGQEDEEE